jgi:hypothetical protein
MTPTTITILAVAAYFAVGYGASIYVYVKGSNATGEPGYDPAGEAAQAFCLWPLLMLTIPHRYFAALVKKLNTPAPVQVSGAFAGEKVKPSGQMLRVPCAPHVETSDPMARFTHAGRVWEPVSIKSSFPGESFMSCRAVDDD